MSVAPAQPARSGRSWRAIRQEVNSGAMSRQGRRRRLREGGRIALLCVAIGGLAWGTYETVHAWQADRTGVGRVLDGEPLGEPMLLTDGTLTRAWLRETLALPRGASLMSLDLVALRDRLQAHRQVRSAVLTRSFPGTLVVTLQERTPVARIQVQDGAGRPRPLLVARDGVAYDGVGYDPAMVETLPWLKGFTLRREGRGYAPIPGMEAVATLLATAQNEAPWLYRTWRVVSLERLDAHDEIVVGALDVPEVVFSRRADFFRQLARLDLVLDRTREGTDAAVQRVDLALGTQVTVQFDRPPEQVGVPPRPDFNLQPGKTRGNRDL